MKPYILNWLGVVVASNLLALPGWLDTRIPLPLRVAAFALLNFVVLPVAMWLGEIRRRRAERYQEGFRQINEAIDRGEFVEADSAMESESGEGIEERPRLRRRRHHPESDETSAHDRATGTDE